MIEKIKASRSEKLIFIFILYDVFAVTFMPLIKNIFCKPNYEKMGD